MDGSTRRRPGPGSEPSTGFSCAVLFGGLLVVVVLVFVMSLATGPGPNVEDIGSFLVGLVVMGALAVIAMIGLIVCLVKRSVD